MKGFAFGQESIALPAGAFAGARRRLLRHDGRTLLGVTAGAYRPYLFPVYTPDGVLVTSEGPADHPHHHSIWVGADHVHLDMPAPGGRTETYAYNCYVNDVFQGRAPGHVIETGIEGATRGAAYVLEQKIEWRGPVEWAAPQGRLLLEEKRTTLATPHVDHIAIDVRCEITAGPWNIAIGPTRHAWFNFRTAASMCVDEGGMLQDDHGHRGDAAGIDEHAAWVASSGPVGGGRRAGLAMRPMPTGSAAHPWWWFVSDWGVVTASPCRDRALALANGATTSLAARFVVFDGDADPGNIAAWLGAP
ncbi:MAG: PmoA family protein [Burkholderiales bacterium]|nr:PmoA family protein [Burkholderiales bacterium]